MPLQKLNEICLFASLGKEQLEKIAKIATIKTLKSKNILYYEGDKSDMLYFLLDGVIKLYKYNQHDKEIVLGYFYTQTLIGEVSALSGKPHQATAEAETQCSILCVALEPFKKDFLKDPNISTQLIAQLISKVRTLMNNTVQTTSAQKLARFIYENSSLFGKIKKYKIAQIINMRPETFSRNLKQLQKKGIIAYNKNNFEILDKEALKAMFACEIYLT
ncbi:MAG: Crp/Fnr family transcriptional regulator [Sulfurospirillaceae bacterium]|nr:Crp/Fnr family transcriptional regulator [Sulfurospirillaceae bacterium]